MQSQRVISPVGPLILVAENDAIVALRWARGDAPVSPQGCLVLTRAVEQLRAYFAGELKQFDLPLRLTGSAFQQKICAAMLAIPFGETRTYGDIARDLGKPAQPVGTACGRNPIPIIVPCHRVLGAKGLGGFSGEGGVETKVSLLRLEGAAGLLI